MKKMDEMEQTHALQAIRITFLYSLIFEIVYWIMECVNAKEFITKDSIMFFLIITQGVVLVLSQFFLKGKVGSSKGILGVIVAFVFALIALTVGFFLMKLGV
ncbi:hypothetical protein [Vagococcus fluvialis]|uniref:hypothetical protein n=1 Tax=Vagococcus fluvialis TaxID=2738 RepID=UPI0037A58338